MNDMASPRSELRAICDLWAGRLQGLDDDSARIDCVRSMLPPLLRNRRLWVRMLRAVAKGGSYPDLRQATMFKDELILYRSDQRLFSLRMFIYAAQAYTPIHDHNAWGVIGALAGPLEVVRYRREDDGGREGFARLRLDGRKLLEPGGIDVTCPLDAGIHKTGNPTGGTSIMLSVYGSPLRRLYINCFDFEGKRVFKMYPPRMKKKKLAIQALEALENSAVGRPPGRGQP